MSEADEGRPGRVLWHELTVFDAERVRDFYEQVVGWSAEPVERGGYEDFEMVPPGADDPVAGICHARGTNAGLPPQWLMYLEVESLDKSAARCVELGGSIVARPQTSEGVRYCVVRDPAGAVFAIYEPA